MSGQFIPRQGKAAERSNENNYPISQKTSSAHSRSASMPIPVSPAGINPYALSHQQVMQLQRGAGNSAVERLFSSRSRGRTAMTAPGLVIQRVTLKNATNEFDVDDKELVHRINRYATDLMKTDDMTKPPMGKEDKGLLNWDEKNAKGSARSAGTAGDYYALTKELKMSPSYYVDEQAPEGVSAQIVSYPLEQTKDVDRIDSKSFIDNRSFGIADGTKEDPTYPRVTGLFQELANVKDGANKAIGEQKLAGILLQLLDGEEPKLYTDHFGEADQTKARTILSVLMVSEPTRFGGMFMYGPLLLHAIKKGDFSAEEAFGTENESSIMKSDSKWPPAYNGSKSDLQEFEDAYTNTDKYKRMFENKRMKKGGAFIDKLAELVRSFTGDTVDFTSHPNIKGADFTTEDGAIGAAINLIVQTFFGTVPAMHPPEKDTAETKKQRNNRSHNAMLYEMKDVMIDTFGEAELDDPSKPKLGREDVDEVKMTVEDVQKDRKRKTSGQNTASEIKHARSMGTYVKEKMVISHYEPKDDDSENEMKQDENELVETRKKNQKTKLEKGYTSGWPKRYRAGYADGLNGDNKRNPDSAYMDGYDQGQIKRKSILEQARADAETIMNKKKPHKPAYDIPIEYQIYMEAHSQFLIDLMNGAQ